jgi:antitoxin (DNA-binding transcriptional repressor) of toxin-antitoxin stability system
MRTVSVREMKANWAAIEAQVKAGEEFVVLNHGKPSVRIVATVPGRILKWDDHLSTAVPAGGKSAEETVRADRDGRW